MKRALVGNGGHAREVMAHMGKILPVFVDDKYLTEDALPLSSFRPDEYELMVAVADPCQRKQIVERLPPATRFFSFVHSTALVLNDVQIAAGCFVGAYCVLTSHIKIGKHAILNRACHIGHECTVGDYFSAMPGAVISGNCSLGDCVYLGSNSCVREKTKIADNVIVGMGAAVVSDITSSGVYAGVPARRLEV